MFGCIKSLGALIRDWALLLRNIVTCRVNDKAHMAVRCLKSRRVNTCALQVVTYRNKLLRNSNWKSLAEGQLQQMRAGRQPSQQHAADLLSILDAQISIAAQPEEIKVMSAFWIQFSCCVPAAKVDIRLQSNRLQDALKLQFWLAESTIPLCLETFAKRHQHLLQIDESHQESSMIVFAVEQRSGRKKDTESGNMALCHWCNAWATWGHTDGAGRQFRATKNCYGQRLRGSCACTPLQAEGLCLFKSKG